MTSPPQKKQNAYSIGVAVGVFEFMQRYGTPIGERLGEDGEQTVGELKRKGDALFIAGGYFEPHRITKLHVTSRHIARALVFTAPHHIFVARVSNHPG